MSVALTVPPGVPLTCSVVPSGPVVVGLKWILMVHSPLPPSVVVEQPSVVMANCPLSPPTRAAVKVPLVPPPLFDT